MTTDKTHREARQQAGKESSNWAEGTAYTPAELESLYADHCVVALESGVEALDFVDYCEHELGIPNL